MVGRIGLLAKGREGRRVVFIAGERTGRVLGSLGTPLDQSVPNIRHPLTALFLQPSAGRSHFFARKWPETTFFVPLSCDDVEIASGTMGLQRKPAVLPFVISVILDQNRITRFFRASEADKLLSTLCVD